MTVTSFMFYYYRRHGVLPAPAVDLVQPTYAQVNGNG